MVLAGTSNVLEATTLPLWIPMVSLLATTDHGSKPCNQDATLVWINLAFIYQALRL